MKKTAQAPANIAFIKYWGKKDSSLNIPANNSISMCMSAVLTTTSVEFLTSLQQDEVFLNETPLTQNKLQKVCSHLDLIRGYADTSCKARVVSQNSFPTGAGLASSSSGFAALTLAACASAGLELSEQDLSILARRGSGSASRSIPSGFVEWKSAETSEESYAYQIATPEHWDITVISLVVSTQEKPISSTVGHNISTQANPYYLARQEELCTKIPKFKNALLQKNFTVFGEILEQDSHSMHATMIAAKPALLYWQAETLEIIRHIEALRHSGKECYYTIDAGPNVHLVCQSHTAQEIVAFFRKIPIVKDMHVSTPAPGARLIE